MEINEYSGKGSYELYEDGAVENKAGVHFTKFESDFVVCDNKIKQTLNITTRGDSSVVPKNRKFAIRFKDIFDDDASLFVNGKRLDCDEILTNCTAIDLTIEPNKEYKIEWS